MRILIAEDDPTSRLLLDRWLTKWGHEVVATENGQEAHEVLAAEDAPHLAILDWDMPIEDGVEVCRLARTMPHLRQLYVIILTAKGGEEDIVQGLSSGANITSPSRPIRANCRPGATSAFGLSSSSMSSRSVSWTLKHPSHGKKHCRGCCRSVPTARKCATMATTGSKSNSTSKNTLTFRSAMVSALPVFKDVVEPELAEFEAKTDKEGKDDSVN